MSDGGNSLFKARRINVRVYLTIFRVLKTVCSNVPSNPAFGKHALFSLNAFPCLVGKIQGRNATLYNKVQENLKSTAIQT